MTTTTSSFGSAYRVTTALVGLLLLGGFVAACGSTNNTAAPPTSTSTAATGSATTDGSSSGANSSLSKIQALTSSIQGAEKASFKAVYTVVNGATTETVTVEQDPPKSAFLTPGASVIDTGAATYYCSGSGQPVCVGGSTNPLGALTQLFSPATALAELKAVQTEATVAADGYHLSFSTESYGGQSTTCAKLTGPGAPVKYCVTKQGLLAYASSGSSTLNLSSYSSSAPASDFSLPSGATIMTIPSGTT